MEPDFWLQRWQNSEIGFHAAQVQAALRAHWPRLGLAKGATVFVPLAGKSLDMAWLADEGFRVVGVELSAIAVDAFFGERGVTPEVSQRGNCVVKSFGAIEIWRGDFFTLDRTAMPKLDALYDRAALVAMPPDLQARYAAKLAELMPAGAPGLLIGLDYDPAEMSGPPFNLSQVRVRALLTPAFDVDVLDARDGLTKSEHLAKRGISRLEEATYLLKRRT